MSKEVCGECGGKYSNFDELEDKMTTCPWCQEGYVEVDETEGRINLSTTIRRSLARVFLGGLLAGIVGGIFLGQDR